MNDRATITVSARTGEIVLCLVFAALAGYVMFAASRMPMGSYTLPGPGVFPLALGVMLAVASLARVAWQFARPRLERDTVTLGHVNIVIAVAALCGVALALEALGFIITMGAFSRRPVCRPRAPRVVARDRLGRGRGRLLLLLLRPLSSA